MSVTNHGRQHNRERETEPYGQHLCRHTPCLSGTPRSIQQPCYTTALKELNNAEEPLLKHWFSHSFTFPYNFNTMVWNWAIWGGKKTMIVICSASRMKKKKNTMCLIGKKKGWLKRARFHAFSADYLQIHKCTFAFIRWKSLQYVPRMKTKGAKKKKSNK